MTEVYRHWHNTKFNRRKFSTISNDYLKPNGGYWASPLSGYTWGDWCSDEHWSKGDMRLHHDFILSLDAKVLTINNLEDAKLLDDYILSYEAVTSFKYGRIDFEKLANIYDAFSLNISDDSRMRWEFYGWDCDTLLIFNPAIMIKYKGEEK